MPGRIFVTRRLPEAGLQVLRRSGADVSVGQGDDERGIAPEALRLGVADCDVLVALLTEPLDGDLLASATGLRGVALFAVGYDKVDLAAATKLGVPVSNTPGVLTETTADLTWALILSTARRVVEADRYQRAGRYRIWGPNLLLGSDVGRGGSGRRKVLGVVGFGRIGQAVVRRALGFDMDVWVHDPRHRDRVEAFGAPVRWADLEELLAGSDVVTLHVPLTEETRHLVGTRELALMKPHAVLVNLSRGPIVDEVALVRALQERLIGGAGLDVYEHEPAMAEGLAECAGAVLLPHIGSASRDTRDRMAIMAATNALAHLEGAEAPNVLNPQVYRSTAWRRRVQAP